MNNKNAWIWGWTSLMQYDSCNKFAGPAGYLGYHASLNFGVKNNYICLKQKHCFQHHLADYFTIMMALYCINISIIPPH